MEIAAYISYLIISVGFTYWVGKNLHTHGRVFLLESFDNEGKADAVNQLLLVGFYLVNFGFVSLFLSLGEPPIDEIGFIKFLSIKLGIVFIVLGGMHFFNMKNISNMSEKAKRKKNNTINLKAS